MSHSPLVVFVVLALGSALAQAQSDVQAGGSGQSQSSLSAQQNGASAAQSSTGAADLSAHGTQTEVGGGNELNATLSQPLDASRNKSGDEVTAVASEDMKSNGQVVVPRGSKLLGHVTSARPHRGGKAASSSGEGSAAATGSAAGRAASELGVVFDKAVLKDGREVPLHAAIQALARAQGDYSSTLSQSDLAMSGAGGAMAAGRASGGGLFGGVGGTLRGATTATAGLGGELGSTVGGSTRVIGHSAGAVGSVNSAGELTSGSRGVFGIKELEVTSDASGSGGGSVVSSGTRNVRLEKGTRMLLVTDSTVAGSASGSASERRSPTGAAAASGAGRTHSAGGLDTGSGSISAVGAASGALSTTGAAGQRSTAPDDETAKPARATRDPADRR